MCGGTCACGMKVPDVVDRLPGMRPSGFHEGTCLSSLWGPDGQQQRGTGGPSVLCVFGRGDDALHEV